jgi:hypothetical protein
MNSFNAMDFYVVNGLSAKFYIVYVYHAKNILFKAVQANLNNNTF